MEERAAANGRLHTNRLLTIVQIILPLGKNPSSHSSGLSHKESLIGFV